MSGRAIELVASAATVEQDGRLLVEIARSFAEIGSEYFRSREIEALRSLVERSRRLEAFTRAVYRPVELGPTSFAIANDGRTAMGCDRLTVTAAQGGRALAVSGVEFPDRRSDAVRHLERLAGAVIAAGGRYWRFRGEQIESDGGAPPVGLTAAWREYSDLAPGVSADIVVLMDAGDDPGMPYPVGTLIAEWFGDVGHATPDRVMPVAIHAEQALRNSLEATPGPIEAGFRRLAAPLRRRHRPKSLIVGVVLLAAILALTFVSADFTVIARGRLMPVRTRDVFAPSDGVVRSLAVRHGDAVGREDELLTLVDPLLDLEQERIVGELATAHQRLLSVQAERATSGRVARDRAAGSGQLAADEKELTEQVSSLERQLEILKRQRNQLSVRSPIDGVVLTWGADERLADRPVRRGQRLLTVVDLEDDWRLELFVPDRNVGHLFAARHAIGPDLAIDYLLATEPQTTYHATLERVALSTEPDDDGQASLRVSSRLARSEVPVPRPGATVVANIQCGRRAIGYVWFHEIYEAFLTHVLF
ncbi:MAG: HlyD family efflux transporter periplasmic adaptor subunit [Planctomycetaceae bacterium]